MKPLIDFHSHILPGIDDGAQTLSEAVLMLKESKRQGVSDICMTPHFYPDYDEPEKFLSRRNEAAMRLADEARREDISNMNIHLGCEIYFFHGMSTCTELFSLKMGNSPCLLIELPMTGWSDYLLDEVEETGYNLRCIPVIAHIDRYIRVRNDPSYADRLKGRRILVQANASFFLDAGYADLAFSMIRNGNIHFIGSDCHGIDQRRPNMAFVSDSFYQNGVSDLFDLINSRAYNLLNSEM